MKKVFIIAAKSTVSLIRFIVPVFAKVNKILAIIILVMTGCGGNKQSSDAGISIDVTANYPKKELILQDFMDVEYIPLETVDGFYCQGMVQAIGIDIILVTNQALFNDGDIFVFDRTGKGLRKINRFGRGSEEYTDISSIFLDDDNGEVFVIDNSASKTMVYDLFGGFKRSLPHKEGARYTNVYGFDRENLILRDLSFEFGGETPFYIVSKQDGSIVNDIQIPYKERKSTTIIQQDGRSIHVMPIIHFPVIFYQDGWILTETSADTVYKYLPDHSMTPFMTRTPSVQSMMPEIFLFPLILTDSYYFMKTEKKEYDFSTKKGLQKAYLMYDRKEKKIFEFIVYNDDFSNKTTVNMVQRTINNEIAFWQKLEADELVEDLEKGILKGKLKEVAQRLEEESNPVIMLVKHKK